MTVIAALGRPPRLTPTAGRAAVAVGAIGVAYHYSLLTLARNLSVQTPLAYLGLVPVLAVIVAGVRGRPTESEPAVHDRQFDYIVGVPLIGLAAIVLTVLPRTLSTMFWMWRLDLVSLPLFAAGTIALTFGARTLWRIRVAVAFLLFAWPLPWGWALGRMLDVTTELTLHGVRAAVRIDTIAAPVRGQPSMFNITHAGETFPLNVASSCSGVNGVIGFLLLGVALAVCVRGPVLRKAIWLAVGMVVLWSLNVARILVVFHAGSRWGEAVAMDTFHPYVGMITFNIGAFFMLGTMRLFGMRLGRPDGKPSVPDLSAAFRAAVPRFRIVCVVVVAASALLATANAGLRTYELVADDLGAPRLQAFATRIPTPDGWSAGRVDEVSWAKQYFGSDATWVRYRYTPPAGSPSTTGVVYADVVTTSNLRSFSTFDVPSCYRFHGYRINQEDEFDLGGGIRALLIGYENEQAGSIWSSLSWIWPVRTDDGTRYERIVLLNRAVQPAGSSGSTAAPTVETSRLREIDLVALGRAIVREQGSLTDATPLDTGSPLALNGSSPLGQRAPLSEGTLVVPAASSPKKGSIGTAVQAPISRPDEMGGEK